MVKGGSTAAAPAALRGVGIKKKEVVRSERGKGLKFSLEIYEAVAKFTPQTRIKYGPNPKTPGSKSFDRYAKYMKAKTVGEAVKLGSKPADLLWEYQRGHFKVLGGPVSHKPNCLVDGPKQGAEKVLSSLRGPSGFSLKMDQGKRKLYKKVAQEFGFDLDRLRAEADLVGSGESSDIQTGRILADAVAGRTLRDAAKAGRKIRDSEVVEALQVWGFAQNETRLNVLPPGQKWVHSDSLGALRLRIGGFRVTNSTKAYANFTKLLCRWFADHQPDEIASKCVFTGINVNANYAGRVHRDANNEGPSSIRSLGAFRGGQLRYWPKDHVRPKPPVTSLKKADSIVLDLSKKLTLFDGNCAHGVEKFSGERFSLVFFTTKGWQKIKEHDQAALRRLGFQLPTAGTLAALKKAAREAF